MTFKQKREKMRELRERIREIAIERRELLEIQRDYKVELNELKEKL